MVFRLTPSFCAKAAWEIFARFRPRATRNPTSKGLRSRSAPEGVLVKAVTYTTQRWYILVTVGQK